MEDLKRQDGKDYSKYKIEYDEKSWLVKKGNERQKRRALLAFSLGKDWTNVAEVREINYDIKKIIDAKSLFNNCSKKNTWIVRLGRSYSKKEIYIKNLDQAVATELVFSLWVRRRDAHSYNRDYEKGIPIFFDHHITLLGERQLADINNFFDCSKKDYGYASQWRIKPRYFQPLLTKCVRLCEDQNRPLSIHFINNKKKTIKFIDEAVKYVKQIDHKKIDEYIKLAGYNGQEFKDIFKFLINNQNNLEKDAELMKNIINNDYCCTKNIKIFLLMLMTCFTYCIKTKIQKAET